MFEYRFTVRGYELDSYGHVNNAVYLNYFEQARWEILRELGLIPFCRQNQLLLIVTEMNIRYSHEAKVFDDLIIRTDMTREPPYLIFNHKMFQDGKKIKVCSAIVKTILTDKEKIKYDIPDDFFSKRME